jgi:CRP/FNR family transcriptional regulator/CRP/FNR family cyclic AMP-dependent transcriptional regulator
MLPDKALASVPLFSTLNEDQLDFIAAKLKRQKYNEREIIVKRHDPGDALFILISGKVKVTYKEDEGETIIAVLQAGDFFGDLSLLDGVGRSADVVALELTEALILSADDFTRSLTAMPEIAVALLKELAGRLRRSTGWIRSLSSQDVYGRIAEQLLYLADTHGEEVDNGKRINLRLTQHDIAGLVGASRESVNKAMGFTKRRDISP